MRFILVCSTSKNNNNNGGGLFGLAAKSWINTINKM